MDEARLGRPLEGPMRRQGHPGVGSGHVWPWQPRRGEILGLTRNRVLSSHRREDTSTPKYSLRLAQLQGFLYTRRNVARRASTPRGRMSQASPLGSPSFSPQSSSIGLPPSFPPFEPASQPDIESHFFPLAFRGRPTLPVLRASRSCRAFSLSGWAR
jgi:hypothetical protein